MVRQPADHSARRFTLVWSSHLTGSRMHIHWLQHVPFEGLGMIEDWARARDHRLSCTRFWSGDRLPEPDSVDLLIVMGGPMGVHDDPRHPWLADEKRFIRRVADGGSAVLGICLGAQLLALVFGAAVYHHSEREIGWFPVTLGGGLPRWTADLAEQEMLMFHWHSDTFTLPAGAAHLFSSRCCANQGFALDSRIVGLQFHAEMGEQNIRDLIEKCRDELAGGRWVQSEQQIAENFHRLKPAHRFMASLLDHLELRAQIRASADTPRDRHPIF